MQVQQNISLKPYNTFGIDVSARYFVSVDSISDLRNVLSLTAYPKKLILGGGSNILLTKNFEGLVIHINLKGIEILQKDKHNVYLKVNAGENWHEFVLYCIQNNFGGVENLSLIPGNVGTAPIQNIGAYGVELKDAFHSCEAISLNTGELRSFAKEECKFGYRNSIFKNEVKHKYIISSVTFILTTEHHELHVNYGAIASELKNRGILAPTIKDISETVISIRESKLPNPKDIGNSGSFFKNPVISKNQYESLKGNFEDIPCYPVSETEVKVPAGWLIEKAGFKGKTFGNYGVHKKQALVLVNYGGALGSDILKLSKIIQKTVERLFNISVETEVNIL